MLKGGFGVCPVLTLGGCKQRKWCYIPHFCSVKIFLAYFLEGRKIQKRKIFVEL